MDKLSQEYILTTSFSSALDMEELLIRKCNHYADQLKDENLINLIMDMKKECQEHIKIMKDKMIKLNIKV